MSEYFKGKAIAFTDRAFELKAKAKPSRLTIEHVRDVFDVCIIRLDGEPFMDFVRETEPEARAAAQAYVDELIKHFREGGE